MSSPPQLAPPSTPPPRIPDAGVIDEARRHRRARRRRLWAAGAALAAIVAIGAAFARGGGDAGSTRGMSGRAGTAPPSRPHPLTPAARIAPALTGGSYGWSVMAGGGGSCCTTPTRGNPLTGVMTSDTAAGAETASFLAGPELGGVRFEGRRLPMRVVRLQYGLRLVEVTVGHRRHGTRVSGGLWPELRLTALDHSGGVIPRPRFYDGPALESRWWKRGSRVPEGPCRLRAEGLPGLQPQWGHVARTIQPFGAPIVGRAFFSCVDTEFYLHRWPIDAAILLDAAHPGRTPGPLPEMSPVAGAAGYFQEPAMWNGPITARREERWWLLVAGGSGEAQRLEVLRHLTARVRLPRA